VGANLTASSFEASGKLSLYAIFAPANQGRVEQGFAEELARFVKDGVTADELANARKAILAGNLTRRSSDAALASSWASRLERQRTFRREAELEARLNALTVAEVNAAIRRWIAPERVNWSLAGEVSAKP